MFVGLYAAAPQLIANGRACDYSRTEPKVCHRKDLCNGRATAESPSASGLPQLLCGWELMISSGLAAHLVERRTMPRNR